MKPAMKGGYLLVAALAMCCAVLWAAPASAAGDSVKGVVNINEASIEQLQLLPGIGLAKANAIVAYRQKHRFASPDDLVKVKGIGKGLLEKIRSRVVVKGKTTAKVLPKKKRKPIRK